MVTRRKEILQLNEEQFRNAGNHADRLLSILKDYKSGTEGNIITLDTNRKYLSEEPTIKAFNLYLRKLRAENVISIQVLLDV